ncbi:hypothetical protein [uncultured Nonlabens sp.]|jgi:hypothetical protein|uniref:hypothetical protein n=1 Tax=uncultured Nonlabens sp. TaxID=859306 RepID=UPI0030D99989|tara:strand:+ start:5794 stop:6411 length:618 start_codon:yes stop_codon:yes gene_type:complete
MKITTLPLALLFSAFAFAQVGINTTDPQAELDVNGSLIVRSLNTNYTTRRAVRLVGVDATGRMVPVAMGENVELEDNKVVAKKQRLEFGELPSLIIPGNGRIDNLDIVILPGEPNHGKSIIRLVHPNPTTSGSNQLTISGIKSAPDGTQIWLYPTEGDLVLLALNTNSSTENQIQNNIRLRCSQYEMIQLVYDRAAEKWVVMNHH